MVTLPSCCGYNIGWLLRQIVKKGVSFLESLFCAFAKGWGWHESGHQHRVRGSCACTAGWLLPWL